MATVLRRLQLTLALIKPDVTANPMIAEEIKDLLLNERFLFVKTKTFMWSRQQAEHFYRQHAERFFYRRLINFMSSGPITAVVLCRENAISHWRQLMGPTKVYRAIYEAPESIRGTFGLTDTRNSTHGSDSDESAAEEISTIFPDFNVRNWIETVEPAFRLGPVHFNKEKGLHETTLPECER